MEETNIVQIVTIFVSSNQVEELTLQFFSHRDEQFQSAVIKNYTTHSLRLAKDLTSFYVVFTSTTHGIEEQFECDFSENRKENDKITILKSFSLFKAKIEAEIIKQYQVVLDQSSPQREQSFLYSIAGLNLKNLQKKIIKKMEVDELAKPIESRRRIKQKTNGFKKSKTNFMIVNPIKEANLLQKYEEKERTDKKSSTTKYFNQSVISESDQEKRKTIRSEFGKRCLKHRTYANTLGRPAESVHSTKKLEEAQIKEPQQPEIQRIFQTLNGSVSKFMLKKRRARNTYNSVVQEWFSQTKKQLQNQKELMEIVHNTASYLGSSTSSRVSTKLRIRGVRSGQSSPYKTGRPKIPRIKKVI